MSDYACKLRTLSHRFTRRYLQEGVPSAPGGWQCAAMLQSSSSSPHQSKLARNSKSNFARGVGTVKGLLQFKLGRKSVRAFATTSNSGKYTLRAPSGASGGAASLHMLRSPGAFSRACGHALGQTSAPSAVTGNPAQPHSLVVEANFSCPEACCPQQIWTILGWRRMTSGVHSRSEAGCCFCLQAICEDRLPPGREEVTSRTLQSFGKVKCGQHANEHSYAEL